MGTLGPMERSLQLSAIDALLTGKGIQARRVSLHDNKVTVLVGSTDVEAARRCLAHVMQPDAFVVDTDTRNGQGAMRQLDTHNVQRELLTDDRKLDLVRIWSTVVNAFPSACGREIDPAPDGARKALTKPFEIPSVRRGLRFKGQVRLELAATGTTVSNSATLVVDGEFAWRRASQSEWHQIESTGVVDPRGATADDALGRCVQDVAAKVLDLP